MSITSGITRPIAGDLASGATAPPSGSPLLFSVDLQTSITPSVAKGSATPTFTRGGSYASLVDFEGLVREVKSDEARFMGARRVENLITASEDLENAAWKVTAGTVTGPQTYETSGIGPTLYQNGFGGFVDGRTYTLSVDVSPDVATDFQIGAWDGVTSFASGTVSFTAGERKRVALTFTAGNTASNAQFRGVIAKTATNVVWTVYSSQCEDVTGQTNQEPSEYVSVGVPVNLGAERVVDSTASNWTNVGNNTITDITDGVQITYVDSANYPRLEFKNAADVPPVAGELVVVSCEARVTGGDASAEVRLNNSTPNNVDYEVNTEWQTLVWLAAADTGIQLLPQLLDAGNVLEIRNISYKDHTYHGANVDGVKYFNTVNGNTVSSNVVTEATGRLLDGRDYYCDQDGPFGYVSEGSRQNAFTYSEQFDNAAWTKTECTISADAATSPDGATTADKVIPSTNNLAHWVAQITAVQLGENYCCGFFVKAAGYDYAQITGSQFFGTHYCTFDLSTGTIGNNDGLFVDQGIIPLANDWYFIYAVEDATATDNGRFILAVSSTDASTRLPAFAGDGTSGIYVWGAMMEQGSHASTYIATTTGAVTRNADVLTYPDTGNIKDAAGTVLFDCAAFWTTAPAGSNAVWSAATGVFNTGLKGVLNNNDANRMSFSDGANTSATNTGVSCYLTPIRAGGTWGADLAAVWDGAEDDPPSTYGGTASTADIEIGSVASGNHLFGTIRNVRIYSREGFGL